MWTIFRVFQECHIMFCACIVDTELVLGATEVCRNGQLEQLLPYAVGPCLSALTQWSGSGKVSHHSHNPCSSELDGCDGLSGRAPGRVLEARRGSRGGRTQDSPGLLILPFIMRGSSSKSLRCGDECKNTRNVHQLLHSGADVKKKIGVHRGMLDSCCKECIGDGIGGECQNTIASWLLTMVCTATKW